MILGNCRFLEGGHRICIDPRHINLLLEDDNYPLPKIKEIYHSFKGAVIFTKIDLKSGFNQIPLDKNSRELTTFTWENIQYRYTVCPFGFKTIPANFQSIMHWLFRNKQEFVRVYLDDVIVYSSTLDVHFEHVKESMEILTQVNLMINLEKCKFGYRELEILGYLITPEGLKG